MPSGRPLAHRLSLLPEQTTALKQIAHSKTEPLRRVQRAKLLLAAAEGKPQREAAEAAGLSVSAAARLLRKAHQVGPISALEDLHRCGRPSPLSGEVRQWIKTLASTPPKSLSDGPADALWSLTSLTEYVRRHAAQKNLSPALVKISKSTIWNILAEGNTQPQRMQYQLEKRTPMHDGAKRETLLLHTRVVIGGEIRQAPDCRSCAEFDASSLEEMHHGQPAEQPSSSRRTIKMTLFAAIDLVTGKIHGIVREHARSLDFVDFLKFVDAKCPTDSPVFMMLDKRFLPSSRETRAYLDLRKDRFQFIFLPKQASCMNLVEIFFQKMTRSGLFGVKISSADELKSRINRWVEECNDDVLAPSDMRASACQH